MDTEKNTSSVDQGDCIEVGSDSNNLSHKFYEPALPTWRLVVLIVCLCFGLFLSLIDTSIVATSLYTVGTEFNSLENVTWVALAYTLAYLGCAVIFARLGDIIGRRDAFAGAFVVFIAFSIGCGFAQSLNQLIACRAMQGIGGSGLYSLSMVIFPEIGPPTMMKWIASLAGAVVALAGVLGPVLGGVITHYTTWRWVFWINAPIGIPPLLLFCFAWPKPNQIRHAERRPFRELDFVGCFLLIAASVLVVFALQEGGLTAGAWSTALFIAPLVIGVCCWVLLFGWEVTIAHLFPTSIAGIFPLSLLKRRVYMFGVLSTLFTGFPYFVLIYSLPIRFQVVNETSALKAGIGLLPMLGSTAIGSMLGGLINGTKNRTFPTLITAACLMLLGTGLLSTLSSTLDVEPKTYGFQIFMGLGFGLTVSTVSQLAALECELRDHAVAQGIVAQSRIFGGSIGIAASTAILAATQQRELLIPGIISASQLTNLQTAAKSFSPEQLLSVRQSYSDAFSDDMRTCAIVAGVCVLLTLGVWQRHPVGSMERRKAQIMEEEMRKRGEALVANGGEPGVQETKV